MSPTEFAFLALGLVLGVAVGAAVVEAVRLRPVRRREVRITVAPHSIAARRALTLNSADPDAGRLPVPGSPEAGAWVDVGPGPPPAGGTGAAGGSMDRTIVPSLSDVRPAAPVAIPVRPEAPVVESGSRVVESGSRSAPDPAPRRGADHGAGGPSAVAVATMPAVAERRATVFGRIEDLVSHTVADTPATLPSGADVGDPRHGRTVRPRPPAPRPPVTLTSRAVAIPIAAGHATQQTSAQVPGGDRRAAVTPIASDEGLPREPGPAGSSGPGGGVAGPAGAPAAGETCAAERRIAAERCALAEAAREQARVAAQALREAQRAYDDLRERVDRAQGLADPREIRAAKDAAHRAFRDARAAARDAEDAEAAARDWLHEINRINTSAREAMHVVEAGSAELRARLPHLDRLAVDADAARIAGDSAQAGCRDAQEALAHCEEQALAATTAPVTEEEPAPQVPGWPGEPEAVLRAPASDEEEDFSRLPLVLRVLRGDRPSRERLVAALAGGEPEAGRVWRMRLADLLDAIVARAIEDGFLDFPDEHPFWGMFGYAERRDIVGALSALGFRFDGLGSFADGRVPAQRDLSLAVGYAGLDRMRIRRWPHEEELAGLYREATVAAGEWLAAEAGDLSLGRMVDALGSRAGELADVWNAWGRVRPALLATD